MTKFDNYLSSKELDFRTKEFIKKQGKDLYNEIKSLKLKNENVKELTYA